MNAVLATSIAFILALAFGVVFGVEKLFGPFGTPWDGLFGMTVGFFALLFIFVAAVVAVDA
jgi:hypothetical protein